MKNRQIFKSYHENIPLVVWAKFFLLQHWLLYVFHDISKQELIQDNNIEIACNSKVFIIRKCNSSKFVSLSKDALDVIWDRKKQVGKVSGWMCYGYDSGCCVHMDIPEIKLNDTGKVNSIMVSWLLNNLTLELCLSACVCVCVCTFLYVCVFVFLWPIILDSHNYWCLYWQDFVRFESQISRTKDCKEVTGLCRIY